MATGIGKLAEDLPASALTSGPGPLLLVPAASTSNEISSSSSISLTSSSALLPTRTTFSGSSPAKVRTAAAAVRSLAGLEPEKVVRVGNKADELVKLIEEDEDISLLVLAAGTGREGPGPLVSALAGKSSASFPIPVAIVPGHLEDEEIDALA